MMATVPVLSDGVVTLRPFAAADAAAYAALNREPENVRWSASQAGMTESQALHAITGPIAEGWRIGTTRRLAIIGPDGELAGTTALHNVNNGSASLGIKLTAAARGRGLARRSVQLMVDYAFGPVALQVLHWHAVVGNEPSRRLAEAAGFRLEGTVRGYSYADGAPADAWIFSLLPADLLPGDPLPADLLPGDRLPTQPPVLDLEPVVPVLSDGTVTLRALNGAGPGPAGGQLPGSGCSPLDHSAAELHRRGRPDLHLRRRSRLVEGRHAAEFCRRRRPHRYAAGQHRPARLPGRRGGGGHQHGPAQPRDRCSREGLPAAAGVCVRRS